MSEIKVLIIGEIKETKHRGWNYYKKLLKIEKEAKVYSSDLQNSDFNYNWSKVVELYPNENTDYVEYEILDKEIIEHYKIIDNKVIPRFDIIIANNILEHIYNLGIFFFFDNVSYHLKEDGLFVIRTDNASYFPYYIPIKSRILAKLFGIGYHATNLAKEIWNENHYHVFTKNHLINLLSKFGFKIEKVEYGVYKFGIKKFIPYLSPRILIIARK